MLSEFHDNKVLFTIQVCYKCQFSLCFFPLANAASDKKLLIVIDTNILMNHLKFVRLLKTREIPGIYKTYWLILIFLFNIYINSAVNFLLPVNLLLFGYVVKHKRAQHNQLK